MKKKGSIVYKCSSCGYTQPAWLGRCPQCGEWNSMQECISDPQAATPRLSADGTALKVKPVPLSRIAIQDEGRIATGDAEFDRDIHERLAQAEREKKDLENRQDQKQEDIDRLKGEQNTLKGKLKNLNTQLTEVANNLEDLENRIEQKEQEIADTQVALEEAKIIEADQYADMIARVRKMYERNDTSYMNLFIGSVLDAGSFSDALYTEDGFEKVAAYDKRKLAEFKDMLK